MIEDQEQRLSTIKRPRGGTIRVNYVAHRGRAYLGFRTYCKCNAPIGSGVRIPLEEIPTLLSVIARAEQIVEDGRGGHE